MTGRVDWNPGGLGFPGAGLKDDRAAATSLFRFSPHLRSRTVLGASVASVPLSYGWLALLAVQGGPVCLEVLLEGLYLVVGESAFGGTPHAAGAALTEFRGRCCRRC